MYNISLGTMFENDFAMPEGPSILLMKENLISFAGKKLISVNGNSKIEKEILVGQRLNGIRTFGKQTYLIFETINVRIHLLMFGSYSVNEQTKPDKSLRLGLHFNQGSIFFYTCSIKLVDDDFLKSIPWEADVLSDDWNPKIAKLKLKKMSHTMVCDVLLDQDIFAGVGNIIKNEVLFRIGVQPESLVGNLSAIKLNAMVKEARNYSFDFLEWKREFILKKNWLVHNKKFCPKCDQPLIRKHTGTRHRRSFYCEKHQKFYGETL